MEFLSEATYVDKANAVLDALKADCTDERGFRKDKLVSTSKIRNILSMAADIYDNVMQNNSNTLSNDIVSRIEYLRVRMIYESGRDREDKVKKFINKANLIEYAKMIGNDKKKYILFYRYMEALIAFHKYIGGNDN